VDDGGTGFAVIYRWRIRDGEEQAFQQAWALVTKSLRDHRGALGSRLHRGDDGSWIAYAQWPDRHAWERSRDLGAVDDEAAAAMRDAVEESYDPITLLPVCDLLETDEPRG